MQEEFWISGRREDEAIKCTGLMKGRSGWPVHMRRTRLRRRLWPFNAVTVPSNTKVGGSPHTPPSFLFFRLRRAVMAIVDEADEDDDDDDEDDEFRISAR